MGFSPGEFKTIVEAGANEFHWELGNGTIKLWNANESELILILQYDEANKAASQLELLVQMLKDLS